MLIKSAAKINLSLYIDRRLPSGFHRLHTIMAEIPLFDELNFTLHQSSEIKIESDFAPTSKIEDNLIYRAGCLLQDRCDIKTGFSCYLKKRIPVEAGLGGGSSNAATTLKALNQLWQLSLAESDLENLARELGTDVPFFIRGGVQREIMHGDRDQEIKFEVFPGLPTSFLLLIKPDFSISTPVAFDQYDQAFLQAKTDTYLTQHQPGLDEKIKRALQTGDSREIGVLLHNDFERILFDFYPQYKILSRILLASGGFNATLTGSGSALYSFFSDPELAQHSKVAIEKEFPSYKLFVLKTGSSF